jgi:hypothetical protein
MGQMAWSPEVKVPLKMKKYFSRSKTKRPPTNKRLHKKAGDHSKHWVESRAKSAKNTLLQS